eukprot:TsM_000881200 transcript=TsM_000881200 gene=TsM_000881200
MPRQYRSGRFRQDQPVVSALTVEVDSDNDDSESLPTLRSKVVVPAVAHRLFPSSSSPLLPPLASPLVRQGQQQERQQHQRVAEELALAQHHLALYTDFFRQFLLHTDENDNHNSTTRRRFIFSQFHTKQCEDYSSPEEGEAIDDDDDDDDDDENGNKEVEGGARHSETGNGMLRQSALLPTPSRILPSFPAPAQLILQQLQDYFTSLRPPSPPRHRDLRCSQIAPKAPHRCSRVRSRGERESATRSEN